ncbi:hypothetical protein Golob_027946 [Gossypium lobatum]|uniref:Uncharacterized protein n=1 Tax=Gossypium lobatum TaxID=34289 RepID=A0A7J8NGC5_9ROSI|nr:hypothetical protein [Gossypium lobatum]
MSNEELLGWCPMRFCTDAETSTGSLCLEIEELKRVNENIPGPSLEGVRSIEEYLQAQTQNEALEKILSESRNEKGELKARVAEHEKTLHHYRNHNSVMELRESLGKIEEMKRRVEELEMAL